MRALAQHPAFRDRRDAGRRLGALLATMPFERPVVVALPRGGVPVGAEVARALGAPLDIGLVRKLGLPGQPEFGVGALGEDGTVVLDRGAIARFGLTDADLAAAVERGAGELERRRRRYRGDRPSPAVADRDVILVDDGIATGLSTAAAARVLRARGARRVIAAVPVSPRGAAAALADDVDALVSLATPRRFGSVGRWYVDFGQVADDEVVALLRRADAPEAELAPDADPEGRSR